MSCESGGVGAVPIPEPSEEEKEQILMDEVLYQQESLERMQDMYEYGEDGFSDGFTKY